MKANRRTVFSDDRKYRYTLWREWDQMFSHEYVAFIGLNPSTADETTDDNTIRRCIKFAKRGGFAAMCMLNLFALRSTDPRILLKAEDPVGPENDKYILRICAGAKLIVVAWGAKGRYKDRDKSACTKLNKFKLHCLGVTKDSAPRHPLYLRNNVKFMRYRP